MRGRRLVNWVGVGGSVGRWGHWLLPVVLGAWCLERCSFWGLLALRAPGRVFGGVLGFGGVFAKSFPVPDMGFAGRRRSMTSAFSCAGSTGGVKTVVRRAYTGFCSAIGSRCHGRWMNSSSWAGCVWRAGSAKVGLRRFCRIHPAARTVDVSKRAPGRAVPKVRRTHRSSSTK